MADFEDLHFVRINRADVFRGFIPRRFFEQVKDHKFNIDTIYKLAETFIPSVTTHFYALLDDSNVIRGILWANINVITEAIQVSVLSIDEEYQFGNAIKKTTEFIKSWRGENETLRIEFITTRPKAYEGVGGVESKRKIVEIQEI